MIFYRPFRRPRALTFDLDDTLYDNQPIIDAAEQACLIHLHQRYPQTRHTDVGFWRAQRERQLRRRPQWGHDMSVLRQQSLYSGLKACGLADEVIDAAVESTYACFYQVRSAFNVSPDIRALLKRLAARVPLVAITNGNVNLRAIGIDHYFSASLHANLKQPMKPHADMFHRAAELVRQRPQDILHVGDHLEKDVLGAIRAGFQACWYAHNRDMHLPREPAILLPHVHLNNLNDLDTLV